MIVLLIGLLTFLATLFLVLALDALLTHFFGKGIRGLARSVSLDFDLSGFEPPKREPRASNGSGSSAAKAPGPGKPD